MDGQTEIPPVLKELQVARSVVHVFNTFTMRIGAWWPLHLHSVSDNPKATVTLEPRVGGRLLERGEDDSEHVWGVITTWEPMQRIGFTWHPGSEPQFAQEVEIRFSSVAGGTRVSLSHGGWERLGELGRETRDDYEDGWDVVFLETFGNFVRGPAEVSVLLHRPGPAWKPGVSFRSQPGVAAHVEFMVSLHDQGLLYMGGPFSDDSGAMAIVALDVDSARKVAAADPSIRDGILQVEVHPWMGTVGSLA